MRGAPQRGLSRLIWRISLRVSSETGGRPGCPWRTFQVQNSRKPLTVPADHGPQLNDDEGRAPAGPELGQPCPEESISGGQLRSLDRTLQDPELVAQSKDLKLKGRSGAEQRQKRREQCCENEGWGESTEGGQLPLYQPNRDFREPQIPPSKSSPSDNRSPC